jgi:hypothetical protein
MHDFRRFVYFLLRPFRCARRRTQRIVGVRRPQARNALFFGVRQVFIRLARVAKSRVPAAIGNFDRLQ